MPYRPIALVVEDDELQRASAAILLEGSEMDVFQCESGEAAELTLEKVGGALCFLFTDVNLAGSTTGVDLANLAIARYPQMRVIVTSGHEAPPLPHGARFMKKPWDSLELLREANEACAH